jgi:hypothetical protein
MRMSQNPTKDEGREREDHADADPRFEEQDAEEATPSKGHGPLKGTDTAATTFAEDLEKAKRTTM